MNFEILTNNYFEKWNSHNLSDIIELFSEDSNLIDWNIKVKNKTKIKNTLNDIFTNCPDIRCEILKVHISESTKTSITEILVHVNKNEILDVVDIIKFNDEGKIVNLKAFKC